MSRPRSEADVAPISPEEIDGAALVRAFVGGAAALSLQADALNAINVFPVPDGDTGTNLSLTMKAVAETLVRIPAPTASDVAASAAEASLMSAKGNSGVILSQILSGFAKAADGERIDAEMLALALERGREAAYRVVSNPKEGTILTAITDAAANAGAASGAGKCADTVLAAAVEGARDAVARTPDLLPVLKDAGVVDAGAQGLLVFLEGMLHGLRGEAVEGVADDFGRIDESWLAARQAMHDDGAQVGFCTEFVIEAQNASALDADEIRLRLDTIGDSLLVVGNGTTVRVHLHTATPEAAFGYARTVGAVSHEKADDMERQFADLAARTGRHAEPHVAGLAVVAVAAGDGIADLLRSIGATEVVRGGQTMNPSAGDIRAAIEAAGDADVIVLPNNKNVILAAELAAKGHGGHVRVVPTRSIPQGVAAIVAMNPEAPLDDNVAAMTEAIASVRTGEVTRAARATRLQGRSIEKGQPIGLIDGDLVVSENTVVDAVRECVAIMMAGRDDAIVTLYAGEGEDAAAASALADTIRSEFGVDVEIVAAGQPHYPYVIGVE